MSVEENISVLPLVAKPPLCLQACLTQRSTATWSHACLWNELVSYPGCGLSYQGKVALSTDAACLPLVLTSFFGISSEKFSDWLVFS